MLQTLLNFCPVPPKTGVGGLDLEKRVGNPNLTRSGPATGWPVNNKILGKTNKG